MLIKPTEYSKKTNILIYISGLYQIDLLENIVKSNKDIDFFIHSPELSPSNFLRSRISRENNCYFESDSGKIRLRMGSFKCLISTACRVCESHSYSIDLLKLAKSQGIPTFELQHGLFQLGISYSCLPSKTRIYQDSFFPKSSSDEILSFYPLDESHKRIGYPPFISGGKRKNLERTFILILSNLHWNAYTKQEKLLFYDMVGELAKRFPSECFIWKLHVGEMKNFEQREFIELRKLDNIVFHHLDPVLSLVSTRELISGAKVVLTTPSTVMMDCEMLEKNTLVYFCKSTESLIQYIRDQERSSEKKTRLTIVRNLEDVQQNLFKDNPIRTSFLYPFDNDSFRSALKSHGILT